MKGKLAFTGVLLAVASLVAVGWFYWPQTHKSPLPVARQVIEMEPDSTPEWIEIKSFDSTDVLLKTEVYYRNGETGTRIWRADRTLARESIRFSDGHERMWAEYAMDGVQIVKGHEVRADGSVRWEATLGANDFVTTTTYWYNSKVFSTERRRIGKVKTERWFYYVSGAKWEHFIGTTDGGDLTEIEEIWHEDGTLSFAHYNGMSGGSIDSRYTDKGVLSAKQTWTLREKYYSGDNTPALQRRVLAKTETYSADGTRVEREYVMASGGYYVDRVIDHNADGSTVLFELFYDGSVRSAFTADASGKVTDRKYFNSRTTYKLQMPSELQQNYLDTLDARKTWQDLEDHPDKRP